MQCMYECRLKSFRLRYEGKDGFDLVEISSEQRVILSKLKFEKLAL